MQNKNIVLIGFMGCGKSTFGKKLSKTFDAEFIDMDSYIEKKENMSIGDIFAKKGEPYFREVESNLIKELSAKGGYIISTGGGVIKDPKNIEMLQKNGVIVYLKSSPQKIYKNLKGDNTRPLLQVENKMQKITELLEQREPLYIKYSQITVEVTSGTVKQITERIIRSLEDYI